MNDYEKIGCNVIKPYQINDRWVFRYGNRSYDLAPAGIMDFVLSPLAIGIDKLLLTGCRLKKIQEPEKGFNCIFSVKEFPLVDVKLQFEEIKANGWIYSVHEVNLQGVMKGQKAWICSYLQLYFAKPPETIFIKLESLE